jgi:hypothetical protein
MQAAILAAQAGYHPDAAQYGAPHPADAYGAPHPADAYGGHHSGAWNVSGQHGGAPHPGGPGGPHAGMHPGMDPRQQQAIAMQQQVLLYTGPHTTASAW